MKGKGKGQPPPPTIPGEGWHVASSVCMEMGKAHLDSSTLLGTKHCQCTVVAVPVQCDAVKDCGILAEHDSTIEDSVENHQEDHIELEISVAIQEYRDVSCIPCAA